LSHRPNRKNKEKAHKTMSDVKFLTRNDGPQLAYIRTPAAAIRDAPLPCVVFLGGFRSDMTGTKAQYLESRCRERGQAYLRFDYSGHGQSAGRFEQGTIESWRDDALAVIDRLTGGPLILVGSSMGGWIALLAALARPDRVCGFIGIAAAPDFTRHMLDDGFDDVMRESYAARGYAELPNPYSPQPYIVTRGLIESGNRVCLLNGRHALPLPVRLLQGLQDHAVSGDTPQKIADCLDGADIKIHLIDDGDHSLSRIQDLELLDMQVQEINALFAFI
jgi:pimeloyl-ACP methyl ester carboxylesterase